jgi:hypothetical protein
MRNSIETFFDAWGLPDPAQRAAAIEASVAETAVYADPRSEGVLTGPKAITQYVSMFSANAPGWTAQVVKSDEVAGMTRVTVAFGGRTPDGNQMVQHGQYFADISGGKIIRMVGFVGTGAPE